MPSALLWVVISEGGIVKRPLRHSRVRPHDPRRGSLNGPGCGSDPYCDASMTAIFSSSFLGLYIAPSMQQFALETCLSFRGCVCWERSLDAELIFCPIHAKNSKL